MVRDKEKWNRFIKEECQIVTLKPEFLNVRIQAEAKARMMLNQKSGKFTANDLATFLELCSTEIVPKSSHSLILNDHVTHKRFSVAFVGQNHSLMRRKLGSFNNWVNRLWNNEGSWKTVLSEFWAKAEVPGSSTGLPTMVLYLKNPEKFNIWLPVLNNAYNALTGRDVRINRSVDTYSRYNDFINENLKVPLGLQPQEIDYILFKIQAEGQ